MSYIGTQAENPNYFANEPTSIELEGGTYNTDRLYRSSTATVTGDITLTNNLVLARITDTGNNVTLTSDGTTRTITGSGKIESGNIVTTMPGNFTGMTGTVGSGVTIDSAVTGSPNLNLGNATFPAGHIIQTQTAKRHGVVPSGGHNSGALHELHSDLRITFTPKYSNSKLLFEFYTTVAGRTTNLQFCKFWIVTDSANVDSTMSHFEFMNRIYMSDVNDSLPLYMMNCITLSSSAAKTYGIWHGTEGDSLEVGGNTGWALSGSDTVMPMIHKITEIKQ